MRASSAYSFSLCLFPLVEGEKRSILTTNFSAAIQLGKSEKKKYTGVLVLDITETACLGQGRALRTCTDILFIYSIR